MLITQEIEKSLEGVAAIVVMVVGFLFVTWLYTQIIFPRLKKLDDLRDQIIEDKIDGLENEDDESTSKVELKNKAIQLENIFLKYELAYKASIKYAIISSILFGIICAIFTFYFSGGNFLIACSLPLVIGVLTFMALSTYPNIDKLRSLNYLTEVLGYNPWMIWGMMNATVLWQTPGGSRWQEEMAGELHIALRQDVWITGWNCYVEIKAHDTDRVYYVGFNQIRYDKNMSRGYHTEGQMLFCDLGGIEHKKTKRNSYLKDSKPKEKHYTGNVLMFMPVYKNEEINPKVIRIFASMADEAIGYLGGESSYSISRDSVDLSLLLKGKRRKYKMKFNMEESTKTNKKLLWKIRRSLRKRSTFEIIDYNGSLEENVNPVLLYTVALISRFRIFGRQYKKKINLTKTK